MAMFLEPTFPLELSYGSTTTPTFSNQIVGSETGWESRNINWESSRNKFDAAMLVQTQANLDSLNEFFHSMHGSGYPFKFKDWGDYKSCGVDETIAFDDQIVVDSATSGQNNIVLIKTYTDESDTHSSVRTITQPDPTSVLVGVGPDVDNLVEQTLDVDYAITDGKVVLDTALTTGQVLSAGYDFFLPMRFDSNELSTNLSAYEIGEVQVPVIEVRVQTT